MKNKDIKRKEENERYSNQCHDILTNAMSKATEYASEITEERPELFIEDRDPNTREAVGYVSVGNEYAYYPDIQDTLYRVIVNYELELNILEAKLSVYERVIGSKDE